MDDFLSLVLVAVIYLFAAVSKSGKKKSRGGKQRRGPMRTRAQGEQRDAHAAMVDRQTQDGFEEAFQAAQAAFEAPEHACADERQMHLHEVTPRQFADAAEGEDPCHAGAFGMDDEAAGDDHAENDALAQDVLRGVIMS
ncbi:MAG: hypothetical protein IJ313_06475, partial [Clostridia bacterium]|nr:hypothetical protein [Clostridia bacterium]